METIKLAKDFMFAALFSSPEDKMPLAHLLSDYLGEDYEDFKDRITILPRKLNKEKERSASFEVDILVKKDDGNYETIELNSTYDTIRIERNLRIYIKSIFCQLSRKCI